MKVVHEQSRNTPVKGSFDVVVLGGGPAGASAAIAAARTGVSAALIERYGYMGGQATGGLVIVLCGLTDGKRRIIKGICQETIDEMRKLDATKGWPDVTVDPEILKYVLDRAAMGSGVRLYLHSLVVDLIHNDQVVEYAVIQNKSGRQAIQGKVFIDATGDADSASWCDIKYRMPDKTELLPVTLTFRVGNVQLGKVRQYFRNHPQKWLETIDFDGNAEFKFNGWRMTTNRSEG